MLVTELALDATAFKRSANGTGDATFLFTQTREQSTA
jgi:hypothetical protein